MTLVQALLVTSFDTGYHVVPPIRFEYQKKGDTSIYSQETNARLLTVYPIEIDTTQAIKDIKPPIEAPVAFCRGFTLVGWGYYRRITCCFNHNSV